MSPRTASAGDPRPRLTPDGALALALALALAVLALADGGGTSLAAQTWTEIALLAVGALAAGALVVCHGAAPRRPPAGGRLQGAPSTVAFALLFVVTALSIAWSVVPDQSWLEAARTLSYLAAFGAAVAAARLAPARWPALPTAIGLLCAGLGVWTLVVKVFTLNLDGQPGYGRLVAPFEYWNASGLLAAIGLAPLLWLAARREGGRTGRALATAAIALLITVVVLSYSRSALAAGVCGIGVALAGSHVRLRATAMLALGVAGAAVACAWALANHALTSDRVPAAARSSSGHSLGLVLLAVAVVVFALAWAAAGRLDRTALAEARRRRIGQLLAGLLAFLPIAAVIVLAASPRGLTGEVSHVWSSLTSTRSAVGDAPGRLADLANSRPGYWHQAFSVGAHHLGAGAGAGAFGVARTRYPTVQLTGRRGVDHAHSYVMQTFADLGLAGIAASLLLLLAWAIESSRGLRRVPGEDTGATGRERGAMYALLGAVIAFGVSSAIDWTWFFPGVAVPALVCAGWLAGRGRLAVPIDPDEQAARTSRAGESAIALSRRPLAVLGLTGVAAVTLAAAYAIWQPLRSADADSAAITALTRLDTRAALADARTATDAYPVALAPLQELSALYTAVGQPQLAEAELVKGTTVQPENPLSWKLLGQYALAAHQPRLALQALSRAARLDLTDPSLAPAIARARRELAGR